MFIVTSVVTLSMNTSLFVLVPPVPLKPPHPNLAAQWGGIQNATSIGLNALELARVQGVHVGETACGAIL